MKFKKGISNASKFIVSIKKIAISSIMFMFREFKEENLQFKITL